MHGTSLLITPGQFGPELLVITLGTIHLRRRQIFTFFDPNPLPSAFQQNAYEGDF